MKIIQRIKEWGDNSKALISYCKEEEEYGHWLEVTFNFIKFTISFNLYIYKN